MPAHRSRHASFVYLSVFLAGIALLTPARSEAQTTALFLDSQPGDTVGGGSQKLFLPSTGSVFTIQQNATDEVTIRINGPGSGTFWFLNFNAPNSLPLQVGTYNGATRYPFTPLTGMDVSGGSGCNEETGRFVVRELVYAGAVIQRLAIDFEQHCEDLDPALFGAIRYNSTIASLTPFDGAYPIKRLDISPTANGRVSGSGIDCQGAGTVCSLALTSAATVTLTATPDPGFTFAGWTGTCHGGLTVTMRVNMIEPCAALFLPLNAPGTTSVMLNSQRGEYVVQGAREVYNTQNSVWSSVSATVSGNLITSVTATVTSIGDKDESYLTYLFRAPSGQSLAPGTYDANGAAGAASLMIFGNGRGCGAVGSFTVRELVVVGTQITRLAIDFEQDCTPVSNPLHALLGSLRLNSSVPPTPSLNVQITGGGGQIQFGSGPTVCSSDCLTPLSLGTPVTLQPVPSAGYEFAGWKGDAVCSSATFIMVAPIQCEATFRASTVSADSSSPSSGTGSSQLFTLQYSSSAGATDIATAWVWFNATLASSSANSCLLYYDTAFGYVFLLNDAGTQWQPGFSGSSDTLQNSQCSIALASTSSSMNGNTLTVQLAVTFKSAYAGAKKILMFDLSKGGRNSGWQERGTWVAPAPAVTADGVSPNSGSGLTQSFALDYSSSAGVNDVATAWVWFNDTIAASAAHSCLVYYDRTGNQLRLLDDAGTAWLAGTPGSATTLRNGQCTIVLSGSSTSTSGNSRHLILAMTFSAAFAGAKNIYQYAGGAFSNSGWQDTGDWFVPVPPPPSVAADAAAPDSGAGSFHQFSLTYSSSVGAVTLDSTWVWFNQTLASSAAGSCLVYYDRAANTLNLLNDTGTLWQSAALGSATVLQNSQCAIAVALASATPAGNTLTLLLPMTFKPSFAGNKNIYMYAAGSGVNSGWQDRGDWTVTTPPPPVVTADTVIPSSGLTSTQTFSLSYSSTLGPSDLASTWVWFNSSLAASAAGSCLVRYEPAANQLLLLNDAGTVWQSAIPGAAVTLQNSQCSIGVGGSFVATDGNTLTLTLAMTFKPAFGGDKNIYLYAAGSGAVSGWQDLGDWTVPSPIKADGALGNNGSGTTNTFLATYSDFSFSNTLRTGWIWFSPSLTSSAAGTCLLYYDRVTNTISLLDDAGTTWQSKVMGSLGSLQNSQCRIDTSLSSAASGAPFLSLSVNVTFFPATFAGAKNIYLYGVATVGVSGWTDSGDWTVAP